MKKVPDGWNYAIPRTLIVRSFGDLVETPAPYMRDYMSSFFRMVLYQNGRAVSSGISGKKGKYVSAWLCVPVLRGGKGADGERIYCRKVVKICCNRTKAISLQIRQKIASGFLFGFMQGTQSADAGTRKRFRRRGTGRQGRRCRFRPSAAGRAGECERFPTTRGR